MSHAPASLYEDSYKKKTYRLRNGFHLKAEHVQLAGELYEEISSKNPGIDSVRFREKALRRMKPKNSRYHCLMDTWDVHEAAEKYWLSRVSYIFRAIEIVDDDGKTGKALHIVPINGKIFERGLYDERPSVLTNDNALDGIIQRYTRQVVAATKEVRSLGGEDYPFWNELIRLVEKHELQDW